MNYFSGMFVFFVSSLTSSNLNACPEDWSCLPGKECPPFENCIQKFSSNPSREIFTTPSTDQVTQEVQKTELSDKALSTTSSEEVSSNNKEKKTNRSRQHDNSNFNNADKFRRHSERRAGEGLYYEEVPFDYSTTRTRDQNPGISSQIRRLGEVNSTSRDPGDGDDPRDTPPPISYGEEIDEETVYGIVLVRDDKDWIPEFGNTTTVTAKIYKPAPNRPGVWYPSSTLRRQITVEFVDRSNEKGKNLNTDLDTEPQDSPDVFLNPADNPTTTCEDDPIGRGYFRRCSTVDEHNQFKFVIRSEDYGSFSRLNASCPGCVALVPVVGVYPKAFQRKGFTVAVEEPDQDKRAVDVPKDVNDNQVSDGYAPDKLEYMSANEDSDKKPQGNGVNGDGLSAYEEYRGFFDKEKKQVRTNWKRKTLFVENRDSLPLDYFIEHSELDVVEIRISQHKEQIVNFNSGHGNRVDQHMVPIRYGSEATWNSEGIAGACYCRGDSCDRPKNVIKVWVRRDQDSPDTVAHELGHAVGMPHHGSKEFRPDFETIRPMSNSLWDLLPGNVHSGPVLCGKKLPARFRVAEKGDQGSGDVDCIMQYDRTGYAYQQDAGDFDCMTSWGSTRFGDSTAGTAENGFGRTAGDATTGGNCKSRIWISSE